eukprot:1379282-Amorphochlora_amoeboformis.AAC.1
MKPRKSLETAWPSRPWFMCIFLILNARGNYGLLQKGLKGRRSGPLGPVANVLKRDSCNIGCRIHVITIVRSTSSMKIFRSFRYLCGSFETFAIDGQPACMRRSTMAHSIVHE